MYKYKSKCRWNMLIHLENEIIEIRPGELFESKTFVNSRYLQVISSPIIKKKKGRPKKKVVEENKEELNGSSS
jgi:hypothetical protein